MKNRQIEVAKILDCGAGGDMPPLGLFKSHGFQTVGIEIDEKAIASANKFAETQGMDLNFIKEQQIINRIYEGNPIYQGFIDYILEK